MKKRILGALLVLCCAFLIGIVVVEAEKKPEQKEVEHGTKEIIELVVKKVEKLDPTICKTITVEAGTKQLVTEDFFTEYSGQTLKMGTILTAEELASVGSVYHINVLCDRLIHEVEVCVVDTTSPVIEGVKNLSITEGGSVSYKKHITVTDNSGEEVELAIDNSKADTKTPGTYSIYYSATDSSGNTATAECTLTVKEKIVINEAYVRPMVEKIVKQVTNSGMSDWDKAYALYNWCRTKIYYGSKGDRTSIWTGAYEGIHDRSGDCFTYYATYAAMLDVAGIQNMKVSRIGGTSNHWWNLVNVGDGWYHCDASPRRKGDSYICFMQTDAQVAAYTETYPEKPNYYTFDTSLYPERGTKIVFGK